jgi:hypothetical protein
MNLFILAPDAKLPSQQDEDAQAQYHEEARDEHDRFAVTHYSVSSQHSKSFLSKLTRVRTGGDFTQSAEKFRSGSGSQTAVGALEASLESVRSKAFLRPRESA